MYSNPRILLFHMRLEFAAESFNSSVEVGRKCNAEVKDEVDVDRCEL